MRASYSTDLRHFLDEEGTLPDLRGPVLPLVLFLGSVVAWVTSHPPNRFPMTNVPCRRSPRRRRCMGEIYAVLEDDQSVIDWQCPLCGDNGVIYGWEDSPWDRRSRTDSARMLALPGAMRPESH